MKKLLALAIVAVAASAFVSTESQLLPTSLRITVLDDLGNVQEGATVVIYKSDENYRQEKGAVAEATTDKKGRVTFKKLDPIIYFVSAVKDDLNNNGGGVQTDTLVAGKMNKVNIVIE